MSYSSLWGIDKDFNGKEIRQYHNSWWFPTVVWAVLSDKCLHRKFTLFHSNGVWDVLNTFLNNSRVTSDRVCWELSNQQIFNSKDKEFVADCIEKFLTENEMYDINDGTATLKLEHIQERFRQVAQDIRDNEYEYFVFKNTSVDDTVESWFYDYDNHCPVPLRESHAEFVIIEDGEITDFVYAEEIMKGQKND